MLIILYTRCTVYLYAVNYTVKVYHHCIYYYLLVGKKENIHILVTQDYKFKATDFISVMLTLVVHMISYVEYSLKVKLNLVE